MVAVVNVLLRVVLKCLVDESVNMGVLDVDKGILDNLGVNEECIVVTGVTFGFILLTVDIEETVDDFDVFGKVTVVKEALGIIPVV